MKVRSGGELFEFVQCLDQVSHLCIPGHEGGGGLDYESTPWCSAAPGQYPQQMPHQLAEEYRRIMEETAGCSLFDLFRPVRDLKYAISELSVGHITLPLASLLAEISCTLCNGVCKDTMTIKECAHRFCNDCIQKWIRGGRTTCPLCPNVKVPSRRVLRPNRQLDELVDKLLPDLDHLIKRNPILKSKSSTDTKGESSGTSGEPTDDDVMGSVEETSSENDDEDDEEDEDEEEPTEDDEEDQDSDVGTRYAGRNKARRPPRTYANCGSPMQPPTSAGIPNLAMHSMPSLHHSGGAMPVMKSAYGRNLDELYADDFGCLEIFLVCLNCNLPSAVCSMARELSKRPMKLPVGATTRDAAMILAEKLVRDVLGPFDVHSIIPDLSFVRDGDIWPAMSQVPLSEVCRQVTESRGPIALRYMLSDRLFSLCERIEANY